MISAVRLAATCGDLRYCAATTALQRQMFSTALIEIIDAAATRLYWGYVAVNESGALSDREVSNANKKLTARYLGCG
jgi:hypothetical protein